jgi:hypothetical protein
MVISPRVGIGAAGPMSAPCAETRKYWSGESEKEIEPDETSARMRDFLITGLRDGVRCKVTCVEPDM